jgi:hypothetical protein
MTGNPANNGGVQNAGFAPEVPRTPLSAPADAAAAIRGGGCKSSGIYMNKPFRWGVKMTGIYAEIWRILMKDVLKDVLNDELMLVLDGLQPKQEHGVAYHIDAGRPGCANTCQGTCERRCAYGVR